MKTIQNTFKNIQNNSIFFKSIFWVKKILFILGLYFERKLIQCILVLTTLFANAILFKNTAVAQSCCLKLEVQAEGTLDNYQSCITV
jgi:hypothetical protein